ncbi:MAG: hypothetical protein IJT88_09020 [Kiritimatiellae bacterium]|nr:hypothetical protein [Kiritimatiellia bacterium]
MVVSEEKLRIILDKVFEHLSQANQDGTLHEVLIAIGLQGLMEPTDDIDMGVCDPALGDILVIGDLGNRSSDILRGIAKGKGYLGERFEFRNYDEAKRLGCSFLQNSTRYAAVMCGPVPHSGAGMGDESSLLEELRHQARGYPPLVELRDKRGILHISKTSFRTGLEQLEKEKAIRPDREIRGGEE